MYIFEVFSNYVVNPSLIICFWSPDFLISKIPDFLTTRKLCKASISDCSLMQPLIVFSYT